MPPHNVSVPLLHSVGATECSNVRPRSWLRPCHECARQNRARRPKFLPFDDYSYHGSHLAVQRLIIRRRVERREREVQLAPGQRPPNYIMIFARRPSMASQSPCTFPGSMEGVTRRHLRYGMETPHGHAITKIAEAADFVIGLQGTRRFGGRCSSHVTASLTDLHCSSSAGRPSGRGRPTRPHGPARRSGAHPPLHPLEL